MKAFDTSSCLKFKNPVVYVFVLYHNFQMLWARKVNEII